MENGGNPFNCNTTLSGVRNGNNHAWHFMNGPASGQGGATTSSSATSSHLMCLNLGKRHYFGEAAGAVDYSLRKKGTKAYGDGGGMTAGSSTVVAVRCQVDGCHVELGNAKDYHKKHKVCEVHAKASKVELLGIEQRFCQQCSRFHVVSEFDESKRSCRRRLAGHNERRRKSSQEHPAFRNYSQGNTEMITSTSLHPHLTLSVGCAHSLLSSNNNSWTTTADVPNTSGSALRELIAENRAAILAQQFILHQNQGFHAHQFDEHDPCCGCRRL